jgi:hypothetical protein
MVIRPNISPDRLFLTHHVLLLIDTAPFADLTAVLLKKRSIMAMLPVELRAVTSISEMFALQDRPLHD